AWAGRVSEVPKSRLDGTPSWSVALGAPGPRLLRIEPLLDLTRTGGQRLATIVVEDALGQFQTRPGSPASSSVVTSIAPVTLRPRRATTLPSSPYQFEIASRDHRALVDAV